MICIAHTKTDIGIRITSHASRTWQQQNERTCIVVFSTSLSLLLYILARFVLAQRVHFTIRHTLAWHIYIYEYRPASHSLVLPSSTIPSLAFFKYRTKSSCTQFAYGNGPIWSVCPIRRQTHKKLHNPFTVYKLLPLFHCIFYRWARTLTLRASCNTQIHNNNNACTIHVRMSLQKCRQQYIFHFPSASYTHNFLGSLLLLFPS